MFEYPKTFNYIENLTISKFWWIFLLVEGGEFVVKLIEAKVIHLNIILLYFSPWTKSRWVYRNHSVCPSICMSVWLSLSVRLSVQIRVRPITFLGFDIGLPYLTHGCITMRRCVAYIQDPDTILNIDLWP